MDYFQDRLTLGTQSIISQSSQVISDFDVSYQAKQHMYDAIIFVMSSDEDVHTFLDYDMVNNKDG